MFDTVLDADPPGDPFPGTADPLAGWWEELLAGPGDEPAAGPWDEPAAAAADPPVGELAAALPGPGVLAAVDRVDPAGLDPGGLLDCLVAWERAAAWVSARSHAVLAELAGRLTGPDAQFLQDEVAAALSLAPVTAGHRLGVAAALAHDLPLTRRALTEGRITTRQADTLAEATTDLPPAAIAAVEATVIGPLLPDPDEHGGGAWPGHGTPTAGVLRRRAARAAGAADPEGTELRHATARAARGVRAYPLPDGMAAIRATLPAPDAQFVHAGLTALARASTGATPLRPTDPTLDARRADTLLRLVRDALTHQAGEPTPSGPAPAPGPARDRQTTAEPTSEQPAEPTGEPTGEQPGTGWANTPGVRVQVGVLIDLPTLLGLADRPGHLLGYGPIPASVARALAGTDHARWHRLVTDPVTGHLLDYGRTTYRPPRALRDYLTARDATCCFPGCLRPAEHCDIDHEPPFDPDGSTSAATTGAACRRHHRCKTHGRWHLTRHPDGTVTWTSPTGRRYTVEPADYR